MQNVSNGKTFLFTKDSNRRFLAIGSGRSGGKLPPPPAGVLEVGAPKENVSAPKCIQIGLK